MDQQHQHDERAQGGAARGDAVPQDGLGRDAAHGDLQDDRYQGGSTGRATNGRAGDDLLGIDAASREASAAASDAPGIPRGTDEMNAPTDTSTAAGAQDGLDLAERDDVRRRDPSTH